MALKVNELEAKLKEQETNLTYSPNIDEEKLIKAKSKKSYQQIERKSLLESALESIRKKAAFRPIIESEQILKLTEQNEEKDAENMALEFLVGNLEMRNRSASADAKAERAALENEVYELKH
jgi:hypothetical protein